MRFFKKFSRWKGAGGPTLGSDVAPTTPPNTGSMDNLMVSAVSSMEAGWPCHRIAVTCKAPGVSPDLPATLLFWEDLTQSWYGVGGTVNLKPGKVVFFDTVGLLDRPNVGANNLEVTSGGIAVVLLVTDPGGAAGEYVFAMGPDLTTF